MEASPGVRLTKAAAARAAELPTSTAISKAGRSKCRIIRCFKVQVDR